VAQHDPQAVAGLPGAVPVERVEDPLRLGAGQRVVVVVVAADGLRGGRGAGQHGEPEHHREPAVPV
jgi:hypothetical protein